MTEDQINKLAQLKPYLPPYLARYVTPEVELAEAMTVDCDIEKYPTRGW